MAKLQKSTLQKHFQFGKLISPFLAAPQEDDEDRKYFVTDSNEKTSKASLNEYNVALALEELRFEFQFQLAIAGGRGRLFGIVLDFLVMTVPEPTPLWVHGEHWHMGERRERDLRAQDTVREYMGGAINEPVEIWGDQSSTKELALTYVRKAIV